MEVVRGCGHEGVAMGVWSPACVVCYEMPHTLFLHVRVLLYLSEMGVGLVLGNADITIHVHVVHMYFHDFYMKYSISMVSPSLAKPHPCKHKHAYAKFCSAGMVASERFFP